MRAFRHVTIVFLCLTGLIGASPLMATPEITTTDLPNHGLLLVGANDQRFGSLFSATAPPSAAQALQEMQPYSVILKNSTNRKLVAYALKWKYLSVDGSSSERISRFTQVHEFKDGNTSRSSTQSARQSIGAGEQRILGPFFNIGAGWHGSIPGAAILARQVSELSGKVQVAVSLDAAIFEDGELCGPNSTALDVIVSATLAAQNDVYHEILNSNDAALQSLLPADTAIPKGGPGGNSYKAYYSYNRALEIASFAGVLHAQGPQLVRRVVAKIVYSTPPTIQRR